MRNRFYIKIAFSILLVTTASSLAADHANTHVDIDRDERTRREQPFSQTHLEDVQIIATEPPQHRLVVRSDETHRRGFWYTFLPARLFDCLWPAPKTPTPPLHPFFSYPPGFIPCLALQIFVSQRWMQLHPTAAGYFVNTYKPKLASDFFKKQFLALLQQDASVESPPPQITLTAGAAAPLEESDVQRQLPLHPTHSDFLQLSAEQLLDDPEKHIELKKFHTALGEKLAQAAELERKRKEDTGTQKGAEHARLDPPDSLAPVDVFPPSSSDRNSHPPADASAPAASRERGDSTAIPPLAASPLRVSSSVPSDAAALSVSQKKIQTSGREEKVSERIWELLAKEDKLAQLLCEAILRRNSEDTIDVFAHNEDTKQLRLSINGIRSTVNIRYGE